MTTGVYEYSESDFILKTLSWSDDGPPQLSKFDFELHKQWDKAMSAGVFRYKIDHIVTRILPGPKGYIAQLNTLRATEKRKPQEMTNLSHPFNKDIFNFNWVNAAEVIFSLKKLTPGSEKICLLDGLGSNGLIGNSGSSITPFENGDSAAASSAVSEPVTVVESTPAERHVLIVNVSPVEYGHCLLVPQIDSHRPQVLTETSIRVAIETMLLSGHRGMRMGFNSLCGLASVNHLHFHLYYLDHQILVDHFPVVHLRGRYFEFTGHPCSGFALQLHGTTVNEMARLTHQLSSFFHKSDIAHNVLLTRGRVFGEESNPQLNTIRLFIWPRKKFVALESNSDDAFNVACIELGGHLAVKEEAGFHSLTEDGADAILAAASLPKRRYEGIRDVVIHMGLDDHHIMENNFI